VRAASSRCKPMYSIRVTRAPGAFVSFKRLGVFGVTRCSRQARPVLRRAPRVVLPASPRDVNRDLLINLSKRSAP
jgi:hypothetical protein